MVCSVQIIIAYSKNFRQSFNVPTNELYETIKYLMRQQIIKLLSLSGEQMSTNAWDMKASVTRIEECCCELLND